MAGGKGQVFDRRLLVSGADLAVARRLVVAGATLAPGALALLVTYPSTPLRTVAGLFFLLLLVPALQVVAGVFAGWRAAATMGGITSALTLWQMAGPPPRLVGQPVQWPASFTTASQQFRSTLQPPAWSRAVHALRGGGQARLFVCRGRGSTDDLDIRFDGRTLTVAQRPTNSDCWLQLSIPPDALPASTAPATVIIQPKPEYFQVPEADRTVLIGGWTRPLSLGGRSGGAALLDSGAWRTDDLSPGVPEVQFGRYFVEVRVTDAAGRLVELWY